MCRRFFQILMFVIPGVLMLALGICVHRACFNGPVNASNWVSIVGYDSEIYLTRFCSLQGLLHSSFRHPLMYVMALPLMILTKPIANWVGVDAAYVVLAAFAMVGAIGVFLMWKILRGISSWRWGAMSSFVLWLSFAHVWLLGGLAESFSIGMMLLLLLIWCYLQGVRAGRFWLWASLVCGGLTLTNGFKPILVWLVAVKGDLRLKVRRVAVVLLGCTLLLMLALVIKWVLLDHRNVLAAAQNMVFIIAKDLPGSDMAFTRRCLYVWHAFWCEPMMLHGSIIGVDKINCSYASWIPHVVGICVMGACCSSFLYNIKHPLVRMMAYMLSVDVFLHLALGWGIGEGQVYCGHWFWCIPILIAMLPKPWTLVGFVLAMMISVHNIYTVVNSLLVT